MSDLSIQQLCSQFQHYASHHASVESYCASFQDNEDGATIDLIGMQDVCEKLALMTFYTHIGHYTDAEIPGVEIITDDSPDEAMDEDDLTVEYAVPIRYLPKEALLTGRDARRDGLDTTISLQDTLLLAYGPMAIHTFLIHTPEDVLIDLDLHDMNEEHLPNVTNMLNAIFDEWVRGPEIQAALLAKA